MKHLKAYENIKGPKVGDWVICRDSASFSDDEGILLNDFLSETPGLMLAYNSSKYDIFWSAQNVYEYIIGWKNIPMIFVEHSYLHETNYKEFKGYYIRPMNKKEIIKFSSNKEELEKNITKTFSEKYDEYLMKKNAEKYNL